MQESYRTLAYIIMTDEKTITFDEVEWVEVPGDRADELEITDDDAPGGFYINELDGGKETLPVSSDCRIFVLNWRENFIPEELPSAGDLFSLLKERGDMNEFTPYMICVENGSIVGIAERYVP